MNWDFDDFLKSTESGDMREFFSDFKGAIGELYTYQGAKGMYVQKSSENEKKTYSVYFFFEDKIVTITKEDMHFKIIEYKSKVITKKLSIARRLYKEMNLVMILADNTILNFNNIEDAFYYDEKEVYAEDIKKIYNFY